MRIYVKGVDENIFSEFTAAAAREGLTTGQALNWAMMEWLDKRARTPWLKLTDLKPVSWGKGSERTSEQVDDILYGKIERKGKR